MTTLLPRTRADIAALIPHQGDMCLLEAVLAFDAQTIYCISTSHRAAHLPLRSQGRVSAVHLCEYGAQASALHGALLARQHHARTRAGMLVALRDVQLSDDFLDAMQVDTLHVYATQEQASDAGCRYQFQVLASNDATTPLASGTLTVAYLQEKTPCNE